MNLDFLEKTVHIKIKESDSNTALELVQNFVHEVLCDPQAIGNVFGSELLDHLCLAIGEANSATKKRYFNDMNDDLVIKGDYVVTIASHLESYGGHTLVIEDVIKAQADKQHIILLIDIFNNADISGLVDRFGSIAKLISAPCGLSSGKLDWLAAQLEIIRPEQIWLFNHHQDAVSIAAMHPWLSATKVIFYHHADHNLCLGVHLPGAIHIDPHNIGFYNCREHEGLKNNRYLPLVVEDKGVRPPELGFLQDDELRTCSSGSYIKFDNSYIFNYGKLISKRLKLRNGVHFHIGNFPDDALELLRKDLVADGIDIKRFVHIPWVQSLFRALLEYKVDLYISSFPLGGGRAAIESMGAGIPVLLHQSFLSRFHGGADIYYPEAFIWKTPSEFFETICSLTPQILAMHSEFARQHYEKYHLPSLAVSELKNICDGTGDLVPPPLRNYYGDKLQRQLYMRSFVVERDSKIDECNKEIARLSHDLEAAIDNFQILRKSTSWRITAPIRFVGHLIKGDIEIAWSVFRSVIIRIIRLLPTNMQNSLRNLRLHDSWQNPKDFLLNSSANYAALQAIARERCLFTQSKLLIDPMCSPLPKDLPAIDVSAVTFNSGRWIEGFADSLLTLEYPKNKLIIRFVDNGSTDSSLEKLNAAALRLESVGCIVTIKQEENRGFGAGHNVAIRAGSAPFCLVTNVDLEFEKDSLGRIVAFAVADISNAAAWEFRQKPYEHPKFYDPVTGLTNWNSHACVLLKRTAIEQVGGYDESLFMYGEDVELSYRLRRAGYLLRYYPKAVVYHYSYAYESEIKPLQFLGSTYANLYLRLRYGNWKDIFAIPVLGFSLIKRAEVFDGARYAVMQNLLKLLRVAPGVLLGRKMSCVYFSFRAWDFEMAREGAFTFSESSGTDLPKVSIITRTYRGRSLYLRQAMLSVAHQTYPNIEHIIVEDGGDTQRQCVEDIASITEQTVVYKPLDKVGRSAAGNVGLAIANGRWCLFLDDDDLLFSDHIELLVNTLQCNPQAIAAYSLAWEIITDSSKINDGEYFEMACQLPLEHKQDFDRKVLSHHNFMAIQSVLFERQLYMDRGGFDEDMDALEDWVLWNRYSQNNKFVYVPKITSIFRTPACVDTSLERQVTLDNAYLLAVERINSYGELG